MAPLLELREVRKGSAGSPSSSASTSQVDEGEIVSVIGPNGAGKTTLFNLITGVYPPDGGDILLDGASVVGIEPHVIARRGIARTFQTLRLFLNMSVKENVMAAAYGHTKSRPWQSMLGTPASRREEREISELAEDLLAFFGTACRAIATISPPTASRTPTAAASRSRGLWRRGPACSCSTSLPRG